MFFCSCVGFTYVVDVAVLTSCGVSVFALSTCSLLASLPFLFINVYSWCHLLPTYPHDFPRPQSLSKLRAIWGQPVATATSTADTTAAGRSGQQICAFIESLSALLVGVPTGSVLFFTKNSAITSLAFHSTWTSCRLWIWS